MTKQNDMMSIQYTIDTFNLLENITIVSIMTTELTTNDKLEYLSITKEVIKLREFHPQYIMM